MTLAHPNPRHRVEPQKSKRCALIDNSTNKVPFNKKIDDWFPKMTGGKKLEKGGLKFQDFAQLKSIRDDETVHPKTSGHVKSLREFAQTVDRFRTGIAGVLFDLHVMFSLPVPADIIRESLAADAVFEF